MSGKFYITTAIPYVNAPPHIGHAMEFVQADALVRYHKLLRDKVALTTGADENSLKIVQVAAKENSTPQIVCDRNSKIFREFADRLGLSYTAFIRSSNQQEHWPGALEIWKRCNANGDIYTKDYKGLYCVGCEAFYTESELVDGKCPEHLKEPEVVMEKNYFFRLSKYADKLKELIETDEIRILPEKRKHEVLSFINQGLEDFSVSRSNERAKGWGIPVPNDASQRIYVWFDALGVYLTGVGFGKDEKEFEKWWPADMHVIGKGVIRFHAVYWPAMLMSAGLQVPKGIMVHGYVTVNGQKMSKSLGNVVDPVEMINKYGVDQVRYFLLRGIPTFEDGNFSEKEFIEMMNTELVGNIGNFVHRTLTFTQKNYNGELHLGEMNAEDNAFIVNMQELVSSIEKEFSNARLANAAGKILELAASGNRYFQENEPWKMVKTDKARVETVMCICANLAKVLGIIVGPYMPDASARLLSFLNMGGASLEEAKTLSKAFKINEPMVLFQKIETA